MTWWFNEWWMDDGPKLSEYKVSSLLKRSLLETALAVEFLTMLLYRILFSLVAFVTYFQCTTYTNPLKNPNGSDPFLVYTGGYYYLLTTTWTDVEITRATTLDGLKAGEKKTVWTDKTSNRCCNVWAPEVHYFDGTSVSYPP